MGRKRRAVVIEEDDRRIDDEKTELLPEEADELAKAEAIEEWLGDFQSRFTDQPVRVLVEKFEEGEWSICRKYPLGTFDHEAVRDEFGGGRYRATLFDPNGKYIKGGRNNFKFANPAVKKDVEPRSANPLENPLVLMMIKASEEQSKNMMTLTQAMITANGAKSSGGLPELIEAMAKMQTLTPKSEKPLDNFKETLGIMKLVKEVTGSEESESKGGLMSEIREFLELYPLIKEQLPALKAGMTAPVPASAGGPAVTTTTTAKPGGAPTMDPLTAKIVLLVPRFVDAAKSNAPVPTWAEYLLDSLDTDLMPVLLPHMKGIYGPLVENDDDVYDILLRFAKDPAHRTKIYASIPHLAPYQAWCNAVIDAAVKALTDESSGGNVILDAVGGESNGTEHPPA